MVEDSDALQCEVEVVKAKAKTGSSIMENEETNETIRELKSRLADAERRLLDAERRLLESEKQLLESEKQRKRLHNTIMELKGNVRVFCRVRPNLKNSESVIVTDSTTESVSITYKGHTNKFFFDKVFGERSSQGDVFGEISQLIQSVIDGYKVSIFAYGQTGSGKTYTMIGGEAEQKGLIPLSLEQFFEVSQCLQSQGWKFKMQASILEIYKDAIHDLLPSTGSTDAISNPRKQYEIKHDADGNIYVSNLTVKDVCRIEQALSLLKEAGGRRHVAPTLVNERPSRSHFVCILRISRTNETTGQEIKGVLNLIDLAGSERIATTGATDDRLEESK